MSTALRPYGRRAIVVRLIAYGAIALAIFVFALLQPAPASAQFGSGSCLAGGLIGFANPDPTTGIIMDAKACLGGANGYALTLFNSLFFIEFLIFAIQLGLFRDNLSDATGGLVLKVMAYGFFTWFIASGTKYVNDIISYFTGYAATVPNPAISIAAMAVSTVAFVTTAFTSVVAMQVGQDIAAPFTGLLAFGTGTVGTIQTAPVAHNGDINIIQLIAGVVVMAIAIAILSYLLITVEATIVSTAGVLMLGFAGSKYTMQFAQGFFSYGVSVGAKYLAMYIALALAAPQITGGETYAQIGFGVAAIPGFTNPAAYVFVAIGILKIFMGCGLIWFMPNLAASFVSGQSTASGSAMLGNAMSSLSGMKTAMAGMSGAAQASGAAGQLSGAASKVQAAGQGSSAGGAGSDMSSMVNSTGTLQQSSPTGAGGGFAGDGGGVGGSGLLGAGAGGGAAAGAGGGSLGAAGVGPGMSMMSPGSRSAGGGAAGLNGSSGGGASGSALAAGSGSNGGMMTSGDGGSVAALGSSAGGTGAAGGARAMAMSGGGGTAGGAGGGGRGAFGGGGAGGGGASGGGASGGGASGGGARSVSGGGGSTGGGGASGGGGRGLSGGGGSTGGGGSSGGGGSLGGGAGGASGSLGGGSGGSSGAPLGSNGIPVTGPSLDMSGPSVETLVNESNDAHYDSIAQREELSQQISSKRAEELQSAQQSMAYALSGLASAVPSRGEVQPTAVQVRLGMPDRL